MFLGLLAWAGHGHPVPSRCCPRAACVDKYMHRRRVVYLLFHKTFLGFVALAWPGLPGCQLRPTKALLELAMERRQDLVVKSSLVYNRIFRLSRLISCGLQTYKVFGDDRSQLQGKAR